MKRILIALVASAVMAPALSYARSDAPVTRAEVQGQIVQALRDGTLHQSNVHYPDTQRTSPSSADTSYGPGTESAAQSGWITQPSPQALGQSLYNHH
ncbi:DUF4148 domain-containing protein [Caballeronia ptereochthonis]|uniref:Purine nucleoside phosphorylase n=1 Tax=Caballeronia ptereochthonis TaxID=1777144 RepID=A0A158BAV4_9BURK|nr:DUF4148 domain-containing protein [Caballeronia ptereochthonis]SAK67204.1 hypothetical protein AWB83_03069 [Caballeronia ptereochthonis]